MISDYAEIYLVISPSNKRYVGKANLVTSKGKQHGSHKRWLGHLSDARAANGGNCRLLNEEIRLHNFENFEIIPILTCTVNNTAKFEKVMIREFNSRHHPTQNPNGLNLQEGGNSGKLSLETREIMSLNRQVKPHFCKPHSEETKRKISQTLIDNVTRYDYDGSELPKYVKYINWNDRRGYQIVSHPCLKNKYFVSTTKPLDYLLDMAKSYIQDTAFIGTP